MGPLFSNMVESTRTISRSPRPWTLTRQHDHGTRVKPELFGVVLHSQVMDVAN